MAWRVLPLVKGASRIGHTRHDVFRLIGVVGVAAVGHTHKGVTPQRVCMAKVPFYGHISTMPCGSASQCCRGNYWLQAILLPISIDEIDHRLFFVVERRI